MWRDLTRSLRLRPEHCFGAIPANKANEEVENVQKVCLILTMAAAVVVGVFQIGSGDPVLLP